MGKALIIGAGGVASVVVHKCCQNPQVFEEILIASRTKEKCDALKRKLDGGMTKIQTAQVDADNVPQLVALIRSLARQWIKDGITVNALAPGVVESADAAQHELLPHLGGARLTTHDDLYAALRYLLSDEAAAVSGLNLTVSAGVGL